VSGYDDTPWLHIRSQTTYHDAATIFGTRAGLTALFKAVGQAIDARQGTAQAVATDGEGYSVEVRSSQTLRDLGPPTYLDQIAREIAQYERDCLIRSSKLLVKQDAESIAALRWCRANGNPHLSAPSL
jgi:hypothetical protein